MGTARYTYNRTVEYLKQPDTRADWKGIKTDIVRELPEWSESVPYQVKSVAVRDACTAVKNAKVKYRKTGEMQEVKFRSRRQRRDSIYVPKSALRSESFYVTLLGPHIRMAEAIPDVYYDCRVSCDNGKFYLCVPVKKQLVGLENQKLGAVAIDPGVRNFIAFYSPVLAGKIGMKDFGRIHRLCTHSDDLMSRAGKAECKAKRRMFRALRKIRERIRSLVDELHHKVAHWLCKTFDVIFLPTFETQEMVSKLRSKTARAMLTWSHYRFKQFIKHKAEEFGSVVADVNEAYTSKTCSACGKIHNIGSKEVMRCLCGITLDRDINGARGIFLRALADTPSELLAA